MYKKKGIIMKEFLVDLWEAIMVVSPFFVIVLTYGIISSYKEQKRLERELEKKVYALEFHITQIEDMIKNGRGGKVLNHLIKSKQL